MAAIPDNIVNHILYIIESESSSHIAIGLSPRFIFIYSVLLSARPADPIMLTIYIYIGSGVNHLSLLALSQSPHTYSSLPSAGPDGFINHDVYIYRVQKSHRISVEPGGHAVSEEARARTGSDYMLDYIKFNV